MSRMEKPFKTLAARIAALPETDDRQSQVLAGAIERILISEWDLTMMQTGAYLRGCESPIEELFALGVMAELWDMRPMYKFESQVQIDKYRVDFRIGYRDEPISKKWAYVLVECDGHDFHERTKEQAKRDKGRDRALAAAGFQVVRFTGSEIWADPFACAKEACDLASTLFYNRALIAYGDPEDGE